jgi:hypothetical protein
MKSFVQCLALVILTGSLRAQQSFPDIGSVTAEEITLKSVAFDPEAEAVILRKDAIVFPDEEKAMITRHRVRMKILKDGGTQYGNIKIRHQHLYDYEKLQDLQASVYNFDASGNRSVALLSPKDVYTRKTDEYFTTTTFTLPELRAGSIVEYTYTIVQRAYGLMERWYFQDELPVMNSRYDFTILPNAEFSYRVMKSPGHAIDIKQDQAQGKIAFSMTSLPGLPDEPYMDAANDYLQRVELQLSYVGSGLDRNRYVSTWEEATRKLLGDENFGIHLDKDIPGAADIVRLAKLIPEEKDRMNFVYRQVYGHMRWNGYYGIYTTEKLRLAWDQRKGNVAELNLVLVNVLRSAGLMADPLLVSERKNGRVNTSQAFLTQFNKVIACVSVGDQYFYIDLTSPQPSVELIPWELLNTTGYLVHKKSSRFLFIQDAVHYRQRAVNITGRLEAGGNFTGEALVIDHGYLRMSSQEDIRRDQSGYVDRQFQKPYAGVVVDSFVVRNLEQDSLPLEQHIHYHAALNQQAEYLVLKPLMFLGMESNPFIAPTRYTDVNFGSRRKLNCNTSVQLPEGVSIDALPKDITFIMPDTSIVFKRMTAASADGRTVVTRLSIEYRKPVFTASEYPLLSAFYKKMYGLIEDPVLLKRSRP